MNLISSTSLLRIRYSGRRFPTRSSPDAPSVVPGFVAAVPAPSATLSRCSWAVTTTPSPPCEIQQANKNTVIPSSPSIRVCPCLSAQATSSSPHLNTVQHPFKSRAQLPEVFLRRDKYQV